MTNKEELSFLNNTNVVTPFGVQLKDENGNPIESMITLIGTLLLTPKHDESNTDKWNHYVLCKKLAEMPKDAQYVFLSIEEVTLILNKLNGIQGLAPVVFGIVKEFLENPVTNGVSKTNG